MRKLVDHQDQRHSSWGTAIMRLLTAINPHCDSLKCVHICQLTMHSKSNLHFVILHSANNSWADVKTSRCYCEPVAGSADRGWLLRANLWLCFQIGVDHCAEELTSEHSGWKPMRINCVTRRQEEDSKREYCSNPLQCSSSRMWL